jgi:hypothetical protein
LLMWGLYLLITIPLSQLTKLIDRRYGLWKSNWKIYRTPMMLKSYMI